MNLDFAAAVFTDLPRKQSQRNHRFVIKRTFTADDLELLIDRGIAERSIAKISRTAFDDVAKRLAHALCNAGPHVVNLTVGVKMDAEAETASVVVETPIIPATTYGAAVHVDELRRVPAPVGITSTDAPASFWRRAGSFLAETWAKTATNPGVEYDGPRGWRDAA